MRESKPNNEKVEFVKSFLDFDRRSVCQLTLLGVMFAMLVPNAHSEDKRTVEITLSLSNQVTHSSASTILLIPEPYIDSRPDGRNILLKALLPDLHPIPSDARRTSSSFNYALEQEIHDSNNYVEISISQGTKYGIAENIRERREKDWFPWDNSDKFPGFRAFRSQMLANAEKDPRMPKTIYLIPLPEDGKSETFLSCPLPPPTGKLQHLYCTVFTEFPHLLSGTYMVSQTRLADWKHIDQQVKSFVTAMIER